MAKKKKTQLKPVVRGFATVSVAKKAAPVDAEPEVEALPSQAEGSSTTQGPDGANLSGVQTESDASDPAKAEEQHLQSLIDKFQDRVEKETVRTIKVIKSTLLSY